MDNKSVTKRGDKDDDPIVSGANAANDFLKQGKIGSVHPCRLTRCTCGARVSLQTLLERGCPYCRRRFRLLD